MKSHPATVAELQARARAAVGVEDADALLEHAFARPRGWFLAHDTDSVDAATRSRLEDAIRRRAAGEPVAYITGRRGFWTLDLEVSPATLVPRPETELLVEEALARLPADRELALLDLGTGSGAVALALARERPRALVTAVDASADALAVAQRNAAGNRVANVRFLHGSWFAPLDCERFDLIASNPPYVADGDPHLAEGDLRFEPSMALSSGSDGLDAIRAIVSDSPHHLRVDGWLLLEHGFEQGGPVRGLLRDRGFDQLDTVRDLEGRDRVTLGRWTG